MLTVLDATLCVAEGLLGGVFGAFTVAFVYVTAESWLKRDDWGMRLSALLFACMFAGVTAALWADSYRHMGEVVRALL